MASVDARDRLVLRQRELHLALRRDQVLPRGVEALALESEDSDILTGVALHLEDVLCSCTPTLDLLAGDFGHPLETRSSVGRGIAVEDLHLALHLRSPTCGIRVTTLPRQLPETRDSKHEKSHIVNCFVFTYASNSIDYPHHPQVIHTLYTFFIPTTISRAYELCYNSLHKLPV